MFRKTFTWIFAAVLLAYAALVIGRAMYFARHEKALARVAKIHSTKLTLADVMGFNVPPDPGPRADATVEGVDANSNGVRDDVELAIFEAHPESARTRAALLQYALALQMEVTQPLVNAETVVAVAQIGDKASACIGESVPRGDLQEFIDTTQAYADFVEERQWNTDGRRNAAKNFYKGNLDSYSSLEETCDVPL